MWNCQSAARPSWSWKPGSCFRRSPAISRTIVADESYLRALTAASLFRALSGNLWHPPLSPPGVLATDDHPHVDDVRRVRLARYTAFVHTADEFGCLPHLRRYFSDLARRLRERWPGPWENCHFSPRSWGRPAHKTCDHGREPASRAGHLTFP